MVNFSIGPIYFEFNPQTTKLQNFQINVTKHILIFNFVPFQATMKQIVSNQTVKIAKGLTVTVKSRLVTVKGPRGVLKRSFKHLALDIRMASPRMLKVEKWFGTKSELAAVRTVCSHIENMIKGIPYLISSIIYKYIHCGIQILLSLIWDIGNFTYVKYTFNVCVVFALCI